MTPIEKALEFFHFDFEFGDEPSDTSLYANYEVFSVKEDRPDMFVTDSRGYSQVHQGTNNHFLTDCSQCRG